MASASSRDTVVVIDGTPGGSPALRDGLARDRIVLVPELDDPSSASPDAVADAIAGLAPEQYGLVGVSAGASLAIRHALRHPQRVSALALVSPLAIRRAAGVADGGDVELEARLGEIPCPTLAIFGQNDASVAPEAAGIYRERIPNCNIAFVYDAGHDIAAERPQALLNLVADYLERRETFIVQNRSSVINL